MHAQRGQRERRQPAGHVAEHAHPMAGQVGRPAGHDGAGHREQRARDPAGDPPGAQHHRDDRGRDGGGQRLGLGQRGQGLPELDHRVRAGRGHPEHVRQLPERHLDADPGQEAEQHRAGQEVGQEAQPGQPGQDEQHAGEQRGQPGQLDVAGRARDGQPDQGAGQQGGGGRVRGHHQVPRGAQHGEQRHRQQQRVQAGDHRHPGDPGVAEHLGDAHRGQRDPGQQIPGQLGAGQGEDALQHRPARWPGPPGDRPHLLLPVRLMFLIPSSCPRPEWTGGPGAGTGRWAGEYAWVVSRAGGGRRPGRTAGGW